MHRRRDDQDYYVIPGGGVEPGETGEAACLRELLEETSLRATRAQLTTTEDTPDGDRTDYFLIHDAIGRLQLGGPEVARNTATNQYELRWIAVPDINDIPLRPRSAVMAINTARDRSAETA